MNVELPRRRREGGDQIATRQGGQARSNKLEAAYPDLLCQDRLKAVLNR